MSLRGEARWPLRTKLHFARFEFKYVLPKALRDDVERELRFFLKFDPYVEDRPDHQYFVRSLYFDDPSYTSFYEKHDGLHTRSKFRVRTYTNDSEISAPYFLEIKGRHNNLVFKHRCELQTDGYAILESGNELTRKVIEIAKPSNVIQQFQYEVYRKRIRPVALVDYWRRPYVSVYDPEFRMTFDERLYATNTGGLFPESSHTRRMMVAGYTVLEVKFRRHIPSWFHRIIQSFQLRRVSISKICEAVETLELAENLS
ncbi:MAG: hypothetical protein CL612_04445 [Anaerolineaceae bacterium]|jgi:hypothetical protein|nr:hypothetical protein [Anaerolineaceae bacterium]